MQLLPRVRNCLPIRRTGLAAAAVARLAAAEVDLQPIQQAARRGRAVGVFAARRHAEVIASGADRAASLVVGRAFDCRDPHVRGRVGDPEATLTVRAYADRGAEF